VAYFFGPPCKEKERKGSGLV